MNKDIELLNQKIESLTTKVSSLSSGLSQFINQVSKYDWIDMFVLSKPLVLKNTGIVVEGMPLALRQAPNFVALETGANNAIICLLKDAKANSIMLTVGLEVKILLAHSLQAGANTLSFNGTSKNIKSHNNPANNIGTAYVSGSIFHGMYDGTQWQDMSQ